MFPRIAATLTPVTLPRKTLIYRPVGRSENMPRAAFDLGQSETRALVVGDDGRAEEFRLEAFRYGEDVPSALLRLVRTLGERTGHSTFDACAFGSTGLHGRVPDPQVLAEQLWEQYAISTVRIADDALTSHLGAFAGRSGVLAAVGTGLVVLGVGPDRVARVDGYGPTIGDDGAGWWIGRQGVIAAMRAHDGRRGGSEGALREVQRAFGPIENFSARVASVDSPTALIATFAPSVAGLAREGDAVARRVWADAGRIVGDAVCAAARRSGLETSFEWSVVGGIAQASDLLLPSLEQTVLAEHPSATRATSRGTSLDGAVRLLHLDGADIERFAPLVRSFTRGTQ